MNEDIQKTALRLPRELHTAIHESAKKSGRTMNAEIVYRLQQSFNLSTIDGDDLPPVDKLHQRSYRIYDKERLPDGYVRTLLKEAIKILDGADKVIDPSEAGNIDAPKQENINNKPK